MKILILFAADLFPVKGMYQVRVYNQIKYLAARHQLDFANIVTSQESIDQTKGKLKQLTGNYYPLKTSSWAKGRLHRAVLKFSRVATYYLSICTKEEIYINTPCLNRQIRAILTKGRYDAMIIHYWYWGYLFKKIEYPILKVIDTHYVVEENLELFVQGYYQTACRKRLNRELRYSLNKQHEYFALSDLIVVNSQKQADLISVQQKKTRVIVAENGQDLQEYLEYRTLVNQHSLLFYGALSSQFNRLALERILKTIYPDILSSDPQARLMIVGSNPPRELIDKYQHPNIAVTGYVEDIKPHIAQCAAMLLPLETGSGFRGRAIEVLSLGVPIVGTENGLQSIGLEHGIQGFLAESNEDMVAFALKLMQDNLLRQSMSQQAREFAAVKYSLEATYGKLDSALIQTFQEIGTGD